jgi:hypothetical protein
VCVGDRGQREKAGRPAESERVRERETAESERDTLSIESSVERHMEIMH